MKGAPHSVFTRDLDQYRPSSPRPSSLQVGGEGVTVLSFDQQKEVDQMIFPTLSDVSLVLVTQGTMAFEHREAGSHWEAFHVCAGDWSLAPGGAHPHEFRCYALSDEPIQSLFIQISIDFLSRVASPLTVDEPTRVRIRKRLFFQDPLLTQVGLALQQEFHASSAMETLYSETIAQMFTVHLLRHYAEIDHMPKNDTYRLTPLQVKRVMEYIEHHLDHNLSLTVLAQQSGVSPFHFARLFRQTTGESPHQYVVNRRIETAQHLLKETDLPLNQIALMTGFSSQSHFTHAFTKHLGQPPHHYRLRHP